jgi:hypothetical protein
MKTVQQKVLYISIILLFVGISGYYFTQNWLKYFLVHIGALGATSILGLFAGMMANKKGYRFWKSYLIVTSVALILGTILAVIWPLFSKHGDMPCGGAVTLLIALLGIIYFFVIKSK